MNSTTDVVVVGGGVIGTSTLYYLSKAGAKTILVEKGILADGTSGSSGGALSFFSKTPGLLMRLARESIEIYGTLEEELDCDFDYRECGTLVPVETEAELSLMEERFAPLIADGLPISTHFGEDLRRMEPELADAVLAGVFCSLGGLVDPVRVALGYAWAAKRLGARVVTECAVHDLIVEDADTIRVCTKNGEISTQHVVNAAGVWSPEVASYLGLRIPVIPRQGQVAIMEPSPVLARSVILDSKYFIVKHEEESSLPEDGYWGLALALEQRGPYVIIGSSRRFVGMDRTPDDRIIEAIVDQATRFFPGLEGRRCISKIACLRPCTPDHHLIIGPSTEVPSFIAAAGHEGDGICLAPITGKLVSEMIMDGRTHIDIDRLGPDRFRNEPD